MISSELFGHEDAVRAVSYTGNGILTGIYTKTFEIGYN